MCSQGKCPGVMEFKRLELMLDESVFVRKKTEKNISQIQFFKENKFPSTIT